jgi:hypothetical protein
VLAAAALAVGLLVGLVSGLTGIGGGVLMVPFLYLLYDRLHVPPSQATVLAHATSLAVIVPTAIRGLIGFRGTGLTRWRSALPLAVSAALVAALTAQVTTRLPAAGLRVAFGGFLLLIAGDLLLRRDGHVDDPETGTRHDVGAALLGIPVGALSAALGVGGGLPATVGMHYVLGLPFRVIAATSLAVITFTGAAGSVSYLLQPAGPLPFGWVVGHVDVGHALPIAIGAVLAAPLGVRWNQRLPVPMLRRVFGVLLVAVAVNLLWKNL